MSSAAQTFYDTNANHQTFARDKRIESKCFRIRCFNNAIKSLLINKFADALHDIRVLDYCCGKGGDILKWNTIRARHITFVDISSNSIEVCKERMKNSHSLRDFKLIVADVARVNLRNHLSNTIPYNLVSCQFALHYGFESKAQAHQMIKNISDSLVTGGFFIATIPHPYEILKRLYALPLFTSHPELMKEKQFDWSEVSPPDLTFGNSFYRVTLDKQTVLDNFPSYGAKYNFWLDESVDCPEYLVHPLLLEKLCEKFGMKMVLGLTNFIEFLLSFTENADEQVRKSTCDLLMRMKVFHLIDRRSKPDSRYAHMNELMEDLHRQNCDDLYGTLTKEEHELISLYGVVAFQKV